MNKKQLATILLLSFFFLSEMKPLLPYFGYYLNYSYISTELCLERELEESDCNGQCYLEGKIQDYEQKDDNSPKGVEDSDNELLFLSTLSLQEPSFPAPKAQDDSIYRPPHHLEIFLAPFIPPPETQGINLG